MLKGSGKAVAVAVGDGGEEEGRARGVSGCMTALRAEDLRGKGVGGVERGEREIDGDGRRV